MGFRLDEKWGKRAFWAWFVGFYLAFMPLYVLGFMGMPRRLERYYVPSWQPLLLVAELGALTILAGIVCLVMQVVVSFRNRAALRDTTGDPWNGRTLEWMTSSPPAPYNFAIIPDVHSVDELAMQKEGKVPAPPMIAGPAARAHYRDIVMPNNTGAGPIIGALAFVLGFAMVWHIWWLAIAAGLGIWGMLVMRSFDDNDLHVIPAGEVELTEIRRLPAATR